MNLQEKLDAKKQEIESSAPQKVLEVMHRATEDLKQSGIMDQVKTVGNIAPDFTLTDYQGRTVSLSESLSEGPVVLGFYRGGW
mgnify:CR=1 FL=1